MSRGGVPDWDLPAPVTAVPEPVVPLPATGMTGLRGRRVIIGTPGLGWRGDLRADTAVVSGGRTYVPVLPEQEWYRAEVEQTEVFAPLVAVDRVWVETLGAGGVRPAPADVVARLVTLDAPPRRDPVPARDVTGLTGRRLVAVPAPGEPAGTGRRDLRAVTEPYSDADGDICVRVTAELDWYRWGWSGRLPQTVAVPVHLLWVE